MPTGLNWIQIFESSWKRDRWGDCPHIQRSSCERMANACWSRSRRSKAGLARGHQFAAPGVKADRSKHFLSAVVELGGGGGVSLCSREADETPKLMLPLPGRVLRGKYTPCLPSRGHRGGQPSPRCTSTQASGPVAERLGGVIHPNLSSVAPRLPCCHHRPGPDEQRPARRFAIRPWSKRMGGTTCGVCDLGDGVGGLEELTRQV